jgi:hypothetical protein
MTKKVSRRHFLRQAALSGAAAVLAACTASPEKTTGLESSPTASKTGVSPVDTATVPAGLEPGPTATVVGEMDLVRFWPGVIWRRLLLLPNRLKSLATPNWMKLPGCI